MTHRYFDQLPSFYNNELEEVKCSSFREHWILNAHYIETKDTLFWKVISQIWSHLIWKWQTFAYAAHTMNWKGKWKLITAQGHCKKETRLLLEFLETLLLSLCVNCLFMFFQNSTDIWERQREKMLLATKNIIQSR